MGMGGKQQFMHLPCGRFLLVGHCHFCCQGTFTAGIGAVGRGVKWGRPCVAMTESANKVKTAIARPPRIPE
jgi:hypothetical protein